LVAKGEAQACVSGKQENHRLLAEYYSRITYFDSQVGKLVDTLEEQGLRDDTVILYMSDHGEDMGIHGYWGKMSFYENVAKVPLIVAMPGGVGKGVRQTENVSLVDVFPTLCDLAGASVPLSLAGNGLLPLVEGGKLDRGNTVFSEYQGQYVKTAMYMLREGNLKFNFYIGDPPELYDLDVDPDELHDLAEDPKYAAKLAEMEAKLRSICDPERVYEESLLSQAKRAFIGTATKASIQTKQRIRDHIKQFRAAWNEPSWDDNAHQSRHEKFLE